MQDNVWVVSNAVLSTAKCKLGKIESLILTKIQNVIGTRICLITVESWPPKLCTSYFILRACLKSGKICLLFWRVSLLLERPEFVMLLAKQIGLKGGYTHTVLRTQTQTHTHIWAHCLKTPNNVLPFLQVCLILKTQSNDIRYSLHRVHAMLALCFKGGAA